MDVPCMGLDVVDVTIFVVGFGVSTLIVALLTPGGDREF